MKREIRMRKPDGMAMMKQHEKMRKGVMAKKVGTMMALKRVKWWAMKQLSRGMLNSGV